VSAPACSRAGIAGVGGLAAAVLAIVLVCVIGAVAQASRPLAVKRYQDRYERRSGAARRDVRRLTRRPLSGLVGHFINRIAYSKDFDPRSGPRVSNRYFDTLAKKRCT
jgi:hypothetical protein